MMRSSSPLKGRRRSEGEGFRAGSRRRTGSKPVGFAEDSITTSWRERPVRSRRPVFQRAARQAATCRALGVALVALSLLAIPLSRAHAAGPGSSEPSTRRKVYDALILRPFGVAQTVAGAVVWVPFYPLAALADRTPLSSDAADWVTETCVTDPVDQTFRKPLGEL